MSSSLISSLSVGQLILVPYVESLLLVFGTIGSILNILLFSQRKLRSNSCCIYFLSSSVSSLVLMLLGIIPQLYSVNHSPDSLFNTNFCKGRTYINQSSAMLCRWFLTIACIDRCLLTSTNARVRLFSTVRIALKLVLLFLIIWLIFPLHILIFIDVQRMGYITCMMTTNTSALYHSIYTIIVGGLLPPLIMLICTKILFKSLQLKRERSVMINSNPRDTRRETRDIQILFMLLLQVVIFIVFTFPYMSFNLYLAFTRSIITKSPDRLAIELFFQSFTEVCVYVFPAATFYSNTLASETFRSELIILFWRIVTCGHGERFRNQQRVAPRIIILTVNKRNELPMNIVN